MTTTPPAPPTDRPSDNPARLQRIGGAAHSLGAQLGITDELAEKITLAGGIAPEYIIGMSAEDIAEIGGISIDEAEPILARAQAIVSGAVTQD